jgi:hypothetical protein
MRMAQVIERLLINAFSRHTGHEVSFRHLRRYPGTNAGIGCMVPIALNGIMCAARTTNVGQVDE